VLCLDAETGAKLWGMSLVRKYGTKVPMWYAGQCPLVENGRVILAPGGQHALLVALDLHTGREIWRTPNPRRWEMTHVSLTPMEFAGRRTYIYEGMKGVAGIAADDGSLVWENADWTGNTAVAASPVVVGENRVFISAGYGAGSMMLELGEEGGRVVSSVAARMKDRAFGSEQHTPIVLDGYIYGVRPNGELVCMNRDAAVAWSSGRQKVFYKGYGPWLAAQGLIYAMEGGPTHRPLGILRLLEATPEGYRQLAEAKVLDGVDAYGPMALAGGLLLVRDNMTMKCLDVAKR
jgi:outer membrane protein assembly factor BamB